MTHPLKSYLQEEGLSVQAFAKQTPVSHVTIYRLIRGDGSFSTDTLLDISDATIGRVSPGDLIDALHSTQIRIGTRRLLVKTSVQSEVTNVQ